jgi:ATP-binding cassette subfamily B protein
MTPPPHPVSETAGPNDHPPAGVHSLWRLRGYLRPYAPALTIMATAALAGVGLTIAIPLVTKAIIDGPIARHEVGPLLPLGLLALALGILEAALIFIRRWVQSNAVLGMETDMRHDLYERLQQLPMAFHGQWQSGQLLSRVTNDLSSIRRFSGFGLLFLVMNTLQVVVVVAVLLHMYWPLGLVVAVSAVPIIVLSNRFERKYVLVSRRVQDEQGDLATLAEEGAVGIRVIKSFGRGRYVSRQYDDAANRLYDTSMEKVRLSAKFWTFLEVIPNLAVVVVLLLGALGVGYDVLTLGTLVAFITLMLSLVWPVSSLGYILAMAQEAMTAAARILEIFDTEPSIKSGPRVLEHPQGHLRLEHVTFAFPDQPDEPVLRDLNLDVSPGETVAVVGATGSGKTVLTSLVPRLYDVTGGRVTIDGVDVRDLDLANLRQIVATAFDEPTLFSMSARENLMLGRRDATEEDLHAAVEVAQAQFVYDLPWGLDTRIGEQGMSLSGGQRQRLALARSTCTPRSSSRRLCGGCSPAPPASWSRTARRR